MTDSATPAWLLNAQGAPPQQRWSFHADTDLVDLAVARESVTVLVVDQSPRLTLLDRHGRTVCRQRSSGSVSLVAAADTGQAFAVVEDLRRLVWLDERLQPAWTRDLPDDVVGLAMDSHGSHVCVSLASGWNYVYQSQRKKACSFETLRPLRFVRFLTQTPGFVVAADYGFFARYDFAGAAVWSQRLWSTVADLSCTGTGDSVQLAGLSHGIQVYQEDGNSLGSFVLEGTAHRVSSAYGGKKLIAATLEQQLLHLGDGGKLLWMANAPDEITRVASGPFGNWSVCGFQPGKVIWLDH
jgi:hypothetical protein